MKNIIVGIAVTLSISGSVFSSELLNGERLATSREFKKEHNPEIKNYEYAIEKLKASPRSIVT